MINDFRHLLVFPNIRPTDITLNLGTYGVRHHDWNGTWDDPELTGSAVANVLLSLAYTNIHIRDANFLVRSHHSSGSGFFDIVLPPETVAGVVSPQLAAYIMNPLGLRWIWGEPPVQSAVIKHLASVTVNLKAELR
jgi:hypothetical protein